MTPVVVALVAGALVLALLLVRAIFVGYPKPALPTDVLSRQEQAIVAACADSFFPPGGPIPLSGTEAGLVAYMITYVGRMRPQAQLLLRLLFYFTEHGPWLLGPRFGRFSRLAHEDRMAVLAGMAESKLYLRRVAFVSMRAVLSMGYLANDAVAKQIGMSPCARPFEAPKAAATSPTSRPEVAA